jgi:hypothetical protein
MDGKQDQGHLKSSAFASKCLVNLAYTEKDMVFSLEIEVLLDRQDKNRDKQIEREREREREREIHR